MGTMADDEARRAEHIRIREAADPHLREARRRAAEKIAQARRTKLYSFGLAGGRRR